MQLQQLCLQLLCCRALWPSELNVQLTSWRVLAAYDRKKYTWKLLYSHMMGFEVDFGHKQAADLIPSSKFDEKQVGYQALTIMLNEVCLRACKRVASSN